jgi:hypothetical protein
LARIGRRVFGELNHADGVQVVKVPVSDAVWSTCCRYCDALSVTMGEGVAVLISHELATVVGEGSDGAVFDLERAVQQRADQLDARAKELDDRAAQLLLSEELLREREARLRRRAAEAGGARTVANVGRNDPCPCGFGIKYKLCHGLLRDR